MRSNLEAAMRALGIFSSVQRLHGFRQVVTHVQTAAKKLNCKLACKAVNSSIASKELVMAKTNQTENRGVGSQPAMGTTCMMTSCVSFREWPLMRSKTVKTQKHKKGPGRGRKATQLKAETRDPPSQFPQRGAYS